MTLSGALWLLRQMRFVLIGAAFLFALAVVGTPTVNSMQTTEYRLTSRDREVRMVLSFDTEADCQRAREIAKYFDHYATCSQ